MIKIDLENLSPPENLLATISAPELAKKLVPTTKKYSFSEKPLVGLGRHAFLLAMYKSWQDHRPFVISPDMIWLLISQGFSQHVTNEHQDLKEDILLSDQPQKIQIEVSLDAEDSLLGQEVFEGFEEEMRKWIDPTLVDVFTDEFSTTGPTEKIAGLITFMKAMSPYMNYRVSQIACGIPFVQLEGTENDWRVILEKARFLKRYKLDWWMDQLIPLLEKIHATAAGSIDKDFWRKMFKIYEKEARGKRSVYDDLVFVDGWITHFFPFDRHGNRRTNPKISVKSFDSLPSQVLDVPFTHLLRDNQGNTSTTPMTFHAGFIGASQDPETFALRPEIGWVMGEVQKSRQVRGRNLILQYRNLLQFPEELLESMTPPPIPVAVQDAYPVIKGLSHFETFRYFQEQDSNRRMEFLRYLMDNFRELLQFQRVKKLKLDFLGKVDIPDRLAVADHHWDLEVMGEISEAEIDRIRRILPRVTLSANGKRYEKLFSEQS